MKLKKLLLVGGIVALGVAFVGTGTVKKLASYAKSEVQAFADKVGTPEREIERLREEVQKLDKVESELKDKYAQEIVQFERLTKATAEMRASVEKERKAVLAFGDSITAAKGQVSYGKAMLSIDDAKRKLKSDANTVAQREKALATMETTLIHREEAKSLLSQELSEIQTVKNQLTNDLDALDVQYQALKLQATKNKHYRDDSKLSSIREGIEKLKQQVEVKKVRVGLDTGKGRVDGPVTESVDEILGALNGKKDEKTGD
jgi:chromosome segregation ATPase